VLNRIYEKLYAIGNTINSITNIKITNYDQIIQTINVVPPLPLKKIIVTPTPTATPTPTPTSTPKPTTSPTPTYTPTMTPTTSPSPTATPSPTPTPSSTTGACTAWQLIITDSSTTKSVTYTSCSNTSTTSTLFTGNVVCMYPGYTPSTGSGYIWVNQGICAPYNVTNPGTPGYVYPGPNNNYNQLP